jgi:hypothetical protein
MEHIEQIQQSLGTAFCNVILFVRAFLECDTTCKPFRKGRISSLKLSNNNVVFKTLSVTFFQSNC